MIRNLSRSAILIPVIAGLAISLVTTGHVISIFAQEQKAEKAASHPIVDRNIYIPSTISEPAKMVLQRLQQQKRWMTKLPAPDDRPGWRKVYDAIEADPALKALNQSALEQNGVSAIEAKMGGVPVLDIRPDDWKDNHKAIVYAHGGAYVLYSARTSLIKTAPMSRATGLRLISVDYTIAPEAKWKEIQEQMISVFKALIDEGYKMKDIAIYGDSAGGGLAISTVLNLRDRGLGMPGAAVLFSPWADLTNEGDTAFTLKDADPTLSYFGRLDTSALAYADGLELNDPHISPMYADFSKGFSPSLIQEGTKTTFLSTSARLYQKLDAAGQQPVFDIYEGMLHVFQQFSIPESEAAYKKSAAFIKQHLK